MSHAFAPFGFLCPKRSKNGQSAREMAEADTNKICQERKTKGKTSTENKHKFARRTAPALSSCPVTYISNEYKNNAKSS